MFILNELTNTGYSVISLYILFCLSIFLASYVVISKNPIVSVLFLIGLFLTISIYLILIGFNFIGLSYLLVYIGAVSILFLFIVMLINVRVSELLIDNINGIPLSIISAGIFIIFAYSVLPYMIHHNGIFPSINHNTILAQVTSPLWDGNLAEMSHITSIGNILYGNYSIWLIITSIILLLAMVGAIVITLKPQTEKQY